MKMLHSPLMKREQGEIKNHEEHRGSRGLFNEIIPGFSL